MRDFLESSAGAGTVSTALWAGTYRVVALPRPEGFRLPAETRAPLRDGEETSAELRFPHGGRLHVVYRSDDNRNRGLCADVPGVEDV